MTTTINGTTITLSGTYVTSGYGVKSHYTVLTLTSTGTIGGNGLHDTVALNVFNSGDIFGTGHDDGVNLEAGGQLNNYNGAKITGYNNGARIASKTAYVLNAGYIGSVGGGTINTGNAVQIYGGEVRNFSLISGGYSKYGSGVLATLATGDVRNYGVINGYNGIYLQNGGSVINVGTIDGVARAITGIAVSVTNYGRISSATGVELFEGNIYNTIQGSVYGRSAAIKSEYLISTEIDLTVTNLGAITSNGSYGTALEVAGLVTNGAINSTSAEIVGGTAAIVSELDLTLVNYGKVDTTGNNTSSIGVQLENGTITNGTKTDTGAFLAGSEDGIIGTGADVTVDNFAVIRSSLSNPGAYAGVLLEGSSGDAVTNGSLGDTTALMEGGFVGVRVEGSGSVANFGTISGIDNYGVSVGANVRIVNGAAQSTGAEIVGYFGGVLAFGTGTVANYGTIRGKNAAVNFEAGGTITNGTGSDRVALIESNGAAIEMQGIGTATNNGTLISTSGDALSLSAGGEATNGSVANTAAQVIGYSDGITVSNAIGTVNNFGTVIADGGSANKFGVAVYVGGTITNGAGSDKVALISGYTGVDLMTGVLTNFGTIDGLKANGGELYGAGRVTNGSISDTMALMEGYSSGLVDFAILTLANFGSIVSTGPGFYAVFGEGGSVTNGNLHDGTALIEGAAGLRLSVTGSVANFGTIEATGLSAGGYAGVNLVSGGSITNGVSGESLGVIIGSTAVDLTGGGTVTNFGLIKGYEFAAAYLYAGGTVTNFGTLDGAAGADAVLFHAGGLLVAEAGSVFKGVVNGGGGTLEVLGAGTLSGLLTNGNVTVSGSLPTATAFTDFHSVDVGSGGSFTIAGNGTIASGETLIVAGTVSAAGTLAVAGSLASSGTIAGAGTLVLSGSASFASGTSLTISHVSVTAGTVTPGFSLPYAGTFVQSGGTIAVAKGLSLTGSATFSGGTVSGAGILQTHSTTTLSSLVVNGGAVWQESGALAETGTLTLGDAAGGSGRLVVEAGAAFDITANGGIAIVSGGTASIANVALFEKTAGTGLSTIAAAISNTGTILVTAGTLDFTGAVSGAGRGTIGSAGTLEFAGSVASTQTIAFAGTTGGDLVLDDPSGSGLSFAGTVSGFSGSDAIDLATFAFSGNPTIGWSQTSSSAGTLTVTDGTSVAKITLFGQYSQSGFGKGHDAGTGTAITYTPPGQHPLLIASAHHG